MRSKLKICILIILSLLLLLGYNLITKSQVSYALSKYGSRGQEVKTIQTKLKNWGYYSGSVDRNIWKWNSKSSKEVSTKKWIDCRWNCRNKNITGNGNI